MESEVGLELIVWRWNEQAKKREVLMRLAGAASRSTSGPSEVMRNGVGVFWKKCQLGTFDDTSGTPTGKDSLCDKSWQDGPDGDGLCTARGTLTEVLQGAWARAGLKDVPLKPVAEADGAEFFVTDGKEGKIKALFWDQELTDDEFKQFEYHEDFDRFAFVKCSAIRTKPGSNHEDILRNSHVCKEEKKGPGTASALEVLPHHVAHGVVPVRPAIVQSAPPPQNASHATLRDDSMSVDAKGLTARIEDSHPETAKEREANGTAERGRAQGALP